MKPISEMFIYSCMMGVWGGDRMGSNNILGKNLVPSNSHFLVFHKTVFLCRGAQNKVWCVLHKEPLMACLCELPWHWSQPSSAGPTAPIRQYTPLCVAIYERSEMNWEMAGVKNMWPYKYQSQTASWGFPVSFLPYLAVFTFICCWDPFRVAGTSPCEILQRRLPSSPGDLCAQSGSTESLIRVWVF